MLEDFEYVFYSCTLKSDLDNDEKDELVSAYEETYFWLPISIRIITN